MIEVNLSQLFGGLVALLIAGVTTNWTVLRLLVLEPLKRIENKVEEMGHVHNKELGDVRIKIAGIESAVSRRSRMKPHINKKKRKKS